MTNTSDDFDAAIAEVQRRVEAGRASGQYPPELDEQLASEFSRLSKDPLWFASYDRLPGAVARVRGASFGRALIQYTSSIPGGNALHQAVGRVVSRQVLGLSQQMATFAAEVAASLDAFVEALDETRSVIRADLLGDIDAVNHRLVRVEQRLARLEADAESAESASAGSASAGSESEPAESDPAGAG